MIIFILGIIVVFLFVLGVAFVARGYATAPSPDKIVPKDEFEKIKGELVSKAKEEEQLKLRLDTLVVDLEKTRDQLKSVQQQGGDVSVLKARETEYQDKIAALEQDLGFLKQKADSQAKDSIDVINQLNDKNLSLQEEINTQQKADPGQIDVLRQEKEQLQAQLEENQARIRSLESERTGQDQAGTGDALKQAEGRIEALTAQNDHLKNGIKQITSKMDELEKTWAANQQEKEKALQEARDTVERLQAEITGLNGRIRGNEDKAKKLEAALAEKQSVPVPPVNVPAQPQALESALPSSNWEEEKKALEEHLASIKQMNARLAEKEKRLQKELVKSRAQAMGLSKICEEFKHQIEERSA